MGKNDLLKVLARQLKTVTIEPSLFIYNFGLGVVIGAQVTTNMLIWCRFHQRSTSSFCTRRSQKCKKILRI
jgi:hypothetical protein